MALGVDQKLMRLGRMTPRAMTLRALRSSLGDSRVALCMHRVGTPRPGALLPELTIPAAELDALIELLLASRPGSGSWLTVTFDDGYADAVEYVGERASRYPEVRFVLFVCPAKAEARAGFRWDLVERDRLRGLDMQQAWKEHMEAPCDVARENARADLREVCAMPEFRLATVAELREVACLPNAGLGNHTNSHFASAALSREAFAEDLERSDADFGRLFGTPGELAFPYGWPTFDAGHVERARARGARRLWSTGPRPYRAGEGESAGVIPRFPVDGRANARALAGWIAGRSVIARMRGPRPGIDEP
jgi:peptidoglycan/xylan/chitin deacetylase (PgdA/CDA1 family)